MSKKVFYVNGNFYTQPPKTATCLYTCDGKIEAIGDMGEIGHLKEEAEETVDLKGMFIYPDFCGFIEEVEFDYSETGDEMLNLYDRKLAKKVLNDDTDKYLEVGDVCNFVAFDMDFIKNTSVERHPASRLLVVNGEVFYDEEAYAEEQWYWLLATQQF